jgi:hypothetical protein
MQLPHPDYETVTQFVFDILRNNAHISPGNAHLTPPLPKPRDARHLI